MEWKTRRHSPCYQSYISQCTDAYREGGGVWTGKADDTPHATSLIYPNVQMHTVKEEVFGMEKQTTLPMLPVLYIPMYRCIREGGGVWTGKADDSPCYQSYISQCTCTAAYSEGGVWTGKADDAPHATSLIYPNVQMHTVKEVFGMEKQTTLPMLPVLYIPCTDAYREGGVWNGKADDTPHATSLIYPNVQMHTVKEEVFGLGKQTTLPMLPVLYIPMYRCIR